MPKPRVNIALFIESGLEGIFDELLTLYDAQLRTLGWDVSVGRGVLQPGVINLALGSGSMMAAESERFVQHQASALVLVQCEPLDEGVGVWVDCPAYARCLRAATQVWDYAPSNVAFLRERGYEAAVLVQPGWCVELERIEHAGVKDIDVLFYGVMSPRRRMLIGALRRTGLCVVAVTGRYGPSRDQLIARARIVLSLRKWEMRQVEQVRLSYLLNNRAFVVAEAGDCERLREGVALAAYDELIDACVRMAGPRMAPTRLAMAQRGYELLRQTPMAQQIRAALGDAPQALTSASTK